jgi:phage antirepressor protein
MNELIRIEINENNEQVVSGRELHKFLEVRSRFNDWFNNRIEMYGFTENVDFVAITKILVTAQGNKSSYKDYLMKISMAKELTMIENNEKGKVIRKYFIECENMWNSPEMILMKANQIQGRMIENYKKEIQDIKIELAYQKEVVAGVTENIDVYQKQKILNRVVKHKGSNFSNRWNELYIVFRETYGIDLKARRKGYDLKQIKSGDKCKSVLEYAVKFGHLDKLYNIALKLYETDMDEIIHNIQIGLN